MYVRQQSKGRPSKEPASNSDQKNKPKTQSGEKQNKLPPTVKNQVMNEKIKQDDIDPPTQPILAGGEAPKKSEDQYLRIGKRATQLYEQKNFPLAKYTFILALEGIVEKQKTEENVEKKEFMKKMIGQYFSMAEECKRRTEELNQKALLDPMMKQVQDTMLESKSTIKFDDITGLVDVKEALLESIIYPNARPDIFQGIRAPPRGILLFGPPGNGKTLIAKAVASESKATFYNVSASTFVSKLMGDGEKIVRALFTSAYNNQPAIIFIDEIDSILKARSEEDHEASRRLKTEFLLQFDGVNTSDQDRVIVIGATNRPEEIDSAAIRRFTKRILIDVPCQKARMNLLKTYCKGTRTNLNDASFNQIASKIEGYSCSDIKALVKDACMNPLRNIKKDQMMLINESDISMVSEKDFEKAILNVPQSVTQKELLYFKNLQKQYNKQG